MRDKHISDMNNHELLEFMVDYLQEFSKELDTITTGNLSHRIGNLKCGLVNCSYLVERTMNKNDGKEQ